MEKFLQPPIRNVLESNLKGYLPKARWFMSKSRSVSEVEVLDHIPLETEGRGCHGAIFILEVKFTKGSHEIYALPMNYAQGERMQSILLDCPQVVYMELPSYGLDSPQGILYDAIVDPSFSISLLECLSSQKKLTGNSSTLASQLFKPLLQTPDLVPPRLTGLEQSNSSIVFPGQYFLKLYRKLEEGIHPEAELGRFLEECGNFHNVPTIVGTWNYECKGKFYALGILQEFVPSETNAWSMFGKFINQIVQEMKADHSCLFQPDISALDLLESEVFTPLSTHFPSFQMTSQKLAQRTAEMHLAFGASKGQQELAPEPITPFYLESFQESLRELVQNVKQKIGSVASAIASTERSRYTEILSLFPLIMKKFDALAFENDNGLRIRIHGDFHLGQILHTGKDFIFVDFEGEPARSLADRRIKRSPLRDVAGIVRSLSYAAEFYVKKHPDIEPNGSIANWARFGAQWLTVEFLKAYFATMGKSPLIPSTQAKRVEQLRIYTLEKAIYEIGYEIDNRPDWISIPIRGVKDLLGT